MTRRRPLISFVTTFFREVSEILNLAWPWFIDIDISLGYHTVGYRIETGKATENKRTPEKRQRFPRRRHSVAWER